MATTTAQLFKRADLVLPGEVTYSRTRVVVDEGGNIRAFDPYGSLLAQGVVEAQETQGKTTVFTLADGSTWSVTTRGCGCGGR